MGLAVGLVTTFLQPKVYEASTVLQIRSVPLDAFPPKPSDLKSDPRGAALETEFEIIRSAEVLDPVIEELDLRASWQLKEEAVRARLRESIHLSNIAGTDLIEIRGRADTSEGAVRITESIAESYRMHRSTFESSRSNQALDELRSAVERQKEVVEKKRQSHQDVIRDLKSVNDLADRSRKEQAAMILELRTDIKVLTHLEDEPQAKYASKLNLLNNKVQTLHPEYLKAKRALEALKASGLETSAIKVQQQEETVKALRRDLSEEVAALVTSLERNLKLIESAEKGVQRALLPPSDITWADAQRAELDQAKSDFENAQRLYDKLKLELVGAEIQGRIAGDPVVMHSEAYPPSAPIYPQLGRNLLLGLAGGAVLGILLAALLPKHQGSS